MRIKTISYSPDEGTSDLASQRIAAGGRPTSANCYQDSAPAAVSHKLRLCNSIYELICQLESEGVISRTRSPFYSPIWPVQKSNGEWRLTVDYRDLNEVMPPISVAVPDMLEFQYELELKADKWYATIDITDAFFSVPLVAECRLQFTFTWRGVQYTWN
ncbi:hypothetical protein TURU_091433 [Turdus rufiventris]|nr:hypothetical protein TURU_091433 [Turdus rufiventris]